ncbi:MAG: hypothetical protein HN337_06955 [Deltaproteobacteria bacterium]|nr:hypothetical protein [Deltaproteobacteria bacterium]
MQTPLSVGTNLWGVAIPGRVLGNPFPRAAVFSSPTEGPTKIPSPATTVGISSEVATVDYRPYRRILRRGVLTQEDLTLADQLYREVSPSDAGLLTIATEHVEHRIGGRSDHLLGAAELDFQQLTDPALGGGADRILLTRRSKLSLRAMGRAGAALTVVPHERFHAARSHLEHEFYQQIPAAPLPKGGSLSETYEVILSNLWWSEVGAMMAGVRFADDFARATGEDLYGFGIHRAMKSDEGMVRSSYERNGLDGVYDYISKHDGYIAYRITALYAALLIKSGVTDYPDLREIMKIIGVDNGHGEFVANSQNIEKLFKDLLTSFIAARGVDGLLGIIGLTKGRHAKRLEQITGFLEGRMEERAVRSFLNYEFDSAVAELGAVLFGEQIKKAEVSHHRTTEMKNDKVLGPRPRVVEGLKLDDDTDDAQKGAIVSRVYVAGTYTEMLARLSRTNDDDIVSAWDAYLTLAESAEAHSAGNVYSRLSLVADRHDIAFKQRWGLGISLMRSGYRGQGVAALEDALEYAGEKGTHVHKNIEVKELVEFELYDLLRRIVDGIVDPALEDLQLNYQQMVERGYNPFIRRRDTLELLVNLIGAIESGLSDKDAAAIPGEIHGKLWEVSKMLGERFATRMQKKIGAYRRWHARKSPPDISIEQLTAPAARKGRGGWLRVNKNLVGSVSDSVYRELTPDLIKNLLTSPALRSLGLSMLRVYPQSDTKAELYRIAVEEILGDATSDQRETIIREYEAVVEAQADGLAAWLYMEVADSQYGKFMKRYKPDGTLPSLHSSHFYWRHMSAIADLLLHSESDAQKVRGLSIIMKGLDDRNVYSNSYEELEDGSQTSYDTFVPSHWWGYTAMEQVERIPRNFRRGLLVKVLNGNRGNEDGGMAWFNILDRFLSVSQLLGKDGYDEELSQIMPILVENSNRNRFKDPELGESRGSVSNTRSRQGPTGLFDLFVPIYEAQLGNGDISGLSDEILRDARTGRRYFSLHGVIEVLQYLSSPGVALRMNLRNPGFPDYVERMAESAIVATLSSVGDGGGAYDVFSRNELSLVETIRELPISSESKDGLFKMLIEGATPEKGLIAAGGFDYTAVWEAYRNLDFLLGNEDYPQGEAALLDSMSAAAKAVPMNPQDPRFSGALEAIQRVFPRIAVGVPVSAEDESSLRALSQDDGYGAYVDSVHYFRTAIESQGQDDELSSRYSTAVRVGSVDDLRSISGELRRQMGIEMAGVLKRAERYHREDAKDVDGLPLESLAARIYIDWQRCRADGKEALADELFNLWSPAADAEEAAAKRKLYYKVLLDSDVSIHEKRRIFASLEVAGDMKLHVRRVQKRYVDDGDLQREAMLYEIAVPFVHQGKISKANETFVEMVDRMKMGDAEQVLASYRMARAADEGNHKWVIDPMSRSDLIVTMTHPRAAIRASGRSIVNSYITIANGVEGRVSAYAHSDDRGGMRLPGHWGRYERFEKRLELLVRTELAERFPLLVKREPDILDGRSDWTRHISSYDYKSMASVHGSMSRTPERGEAVQVLGTLDTLLQEHAKSRANVRIAHIDIDPFMEGLEVGDDARRVITFLIGHMLAYYAVGEQQRILRSTNRAERAERRIAFAEASYIQKWFQMLGFWPGVPRELQIELRPLQDQVKGGFRQEFVDLIERYLPAGADRDAILQNLSEEPLASGTIAEIYHSKLADGTEVVVKGIPVTKESRFSEARKAVRSVRKYAVLFEDELPGARQIIRAIDLFDTVFEREFDLREEEKNANRMRPVLPSGYDIPQYISGLTTEKVIVQRFVDGDRLDELTDLSLQQGIVDGLRFWFYTNRVPAGYFHSDKHPGNIRRDRNQPVTWLLDFGQMGDLNEAERARVGVFYEAIMDTDSRKIAEALEDMGETGGSYSRERLISGVAGLIQRLEGSGDISSLFDTLYNTCLECDLDLADPYLMLIKAAATVEGMAAQILQGDNH